jgi:hypothetical protein
MIDLIIEERLGAECIEFLQVAVSDWHVNITSNLFEIPIRHKLIEQE